MRSLSILVSLTMLSACHGPSVSQPDPRPLDSYDAVMLQQSMRDGTYYYDSRAAVCYLGYETVSGHPSAVVTAVSCTDRVRKMAIDIRLAPAGHL